MFRESKNNWLTYILSVMSLLLLTTCGTTKEASKTTERVSNESTQYYTPNEFEYKDKIYKDNIATALLFPNGEPLAYPVLNLLGNEQLILSFDDFDADAKTYSYTVYHCTSDWSLSDVHQFDYLEGFTNDDIDDYRFAFNTKQEYTQYRVSFPNTRMRPMLSGNYLMVVYQNGDEDDVVLTKRFMVYEPRIGVQPEVLRPNINRYMRTHQRMRFTIDYEAFPIMNPMLDLNVVVLQNGRWDNALLNMKPTFIRNTELVYDYSDQSLFKAGREFRYVDFRNFTFLADRVRNVETQDEANFVEVVGDTKRRTEQYRYWKDLNGRYVIGRYGGLTRLDADYAWVKFQLATEEPVTNGNVYVFGGFANWEPSKTTQMSYNYEKQAYEAEIYLKQGLYNYEYVVWEDKSGQVDDSIFEGSYWQTENDYLILVYFREFGARYEQLIHFQIVNSRVL